MCRIIYGCISMDGGILSGSNEDPALDFTVEKSDEGNLDVRYQVPYKSTPVLNITPVYPEDMLSNPVSYKRPAGLVLLSSNSEMFRVSTIDRVNESKPRSFNFIAIS